MGVHKVVQSRAGPFLLLFALVLVSLRVLHHEVSSLRRCWLVCGLHNLIWPDPDCPLRAGGHWAPLNLSACISRNGEEDTPTCMEVCSTFKFKRVPSFDSVGPRSTVGLDKIPVVNSVGLCASVRPMSQSHMGKTLRLTWDDPFKFFFRHDSKKQFTLS